MIRTAVRTYCCVLGERGAWRGVERQRSPYRPRSGTVWRTTVIFYFYLRVRYCNKMWISGLLFSLSGSVHLANRSFTLSFPCLLLSSCTRLWLSIADIERARGPLVSLANEANLAYG